MNAVRIPVPESRRKNPARRPSEHETRLWPAEESPTLSPREREVLKLLAEGSTLAATAEHFGISYNTAATHARHIYLKLGIRSRAQATLAARQLGLVPPPD